MKKLLILTGAIGLLAAFQGCYKNRYDIAETTRTSIETVSLRKDVAPIVTSGGCGCHNNGTIRQFLFSRNDTIFYETIIAKAPMLYKMAKGEPHPAEGSVFFTPSQASIVRKWVEQGAKDDYVAPPVTGPITYAINIVPAYKASCTGGTCHGGAAMVLDYTILKANEAKLRTMMTSGGRSGHNPVLNISSTTATTFIAWMDGGFKP